jgi:hypothetical protein
MAPSIENENSITVLASVVLLTRVQACKRCDHAHERMTSLCLPGLERTPFYITKQSSSVLLSWSRQDRESSLSDSDDDSSAIEDLST